ncbi:ABC transporter ATP-binding protein [Corynebacterium mayonis]|uniref:ABC transporter ATP-binding protein n=1 Tax=Corynebacterium mayonis TaxID=3062461 RepID=UPI003140512F
MGTVIEVKEMTRRYGDFAAVDKLSLSVRSGEIYGLLGTNGAGKTSTLEVIEGLKRPDEGTVRVLGMDPVRERAEVRPRLGIMLQAGGLPQALTVKESIAMWAGTCSTPRPVAKVLEEVQLTHRADVMVGAISGGEQRRLDLACALVGDPDVLFLDEPTTGLDPESRRHVWGLLQELNKRGVTMILTTHYLDEAQHLCDRLAIMDRGRIKAEGSVAQLRAQQPAHLRYRRDGHMVEIPTFDLQGEAHALLSWAHDNNVVLEDFAAQPATLEQVFLNIAANDTEGVTP